MKKFIPVAGQVLGAGCILAGLYILAGVAVTLIIGGILLICLGMFREGGVI